MENGWKKSYPVVDAAFSVWRLEIWNWRMVHPAYTRIPVIHEFFQLHNFFFSTLLIYPLLLSLFCTWPFLAFLKLQ